MTFNTATHTLSLCLCLSLALSLSFAVLRSSQSSSSLRLLSHLSASLAPFLRIPVSQSAALPLHFTRPSFPLSPSPSHLLLKASALLQKALQRVRYLYRWAGYRVGPRHTAVWLESYEHSAVGYPHLLHHVQVDLHGGAAN